MTVALITSNPLAVVASFSAIPNKLMIPTIGDVYGAQVGYSSGNFKLVNVITTPAQPPFTAVQSSALSLNGNTLTITNTYAARTLSVAELINYAGMVRAEKASAGTTLGATAIPTDLDTRVLLLGYYVKSIATPAFTVQWKKPDNTAITLNAANIQAATAQVGTFLADIMQKEITAIAGINAATITTPAQVDAVFA